MAAHQPNYLPLISFFHKMSQADIFVLADDYAYSKHSFVNRTRIKTADGPRWLTVPVLTKGRSPQLISQVEINPSEAWARKHLRTLHVNYKYAAFFEKYFDFFETLLARPWKKLLDLNLEIIDYLTSALDLKTRVLLSSEMKLAGHGVERLCNMLRTLGCEVYLASAEANSYLNRDEFSDSGFTLRFLESKLVPYHQQFGSFTPDLSVVDLLFNEGRNILVEL
ncbi:MAG: WbqC family protein [bacterium]